MSAVNSGSVEDSTDWLGTPLASFASVEAALRCQVCKEFYDTPMITQCSHTFCSRCIRRCLSNEAKCPACRAGGQEGQLRSNWGIEELVNAFKAARKPALDFARLPRDTLGSKKRKMDAACLGSVTDGAKAKRATRSSSRRTRANKECEQDGEEEEEPENWTERLVELVDDVDEDYQPDDGLVACPMCGTRMKLAAVDPHLDRCTGIPCSDEPATAIGVGSEETPLSSRTLSKPQNSLIPLASINYHTLNEAKLRKKLSELGLPSHGSKQQMEGRHREWMTIWNANCDAARPRRKTELLKDLGNWERIQGSRSAPSNVNQALDIRSKEFDREGYAVKQKDQFADLIANARKNMTKEVAAEPGISSVTDVQHVEALDGGARGTLNLPASCSKTNATSRSQGERLTLLGTSPSSSSPKRSCVEDVHSETNHQSDIKS